MSDEGSLTLACPRCATRYPLEERFCAECGMPLTYAGRVNAEEQAVGDQQRQARKVKPQYTRGNLVRVTVARQQPEAELIQMLLLEDGIPSTLRRSSGFDVPDFLAAGPRDVMVPESAYEAAREILRESEIVSDGEPGVPAGEGPSPLLFLAAGITFPLVLSGLLWLAVRGG